MSVFGVESRELKEAVWLDHGRRVKFRIDWFKKSLKNDRV
jgi:hypothetical protein